MAHARVQVFGPCSLGRGQKVKFIKFQLQSQFKAFFSAILGKGLWPKLDKMIDLTSKLGEINDIEHNKGSKIYPQNQVILDCIIPSIPLKHKCLSIILIWVIVSHK